MHRNREILIVEYFQTRGTRWEIFLERNFSQYLEKRIFIQTFQGRDKYLKSEDRFGADGMIRHWKNWSGGIERIGEI